jgi:hypothetical protein
MQTQKFDFNNDQEGYMTTSNTHANNTNEVLFQKLGQTWYVFSEINGEVVYSAMPEGMNPKETKLELFQVIEQHLSKVAAQNRESSVAA